MTSQCPLTIAVLEMLWRVTRKAFHVPGPAEEKYNRLKIIHTPVILLLPSGTVYRLN